MKLGGCKVTWVKILFSIKIDVITRETAVIRNKARELLQSR